MIQIYNRCPVSTKSYANNSNSMRTVITMPGHQNDIGANSEELQRKELKDENF